MMKPNTRDYCLAPLIYLAVGFWGSHLLHLFRFHLVGWSHISALPDHQIGLTTSFWLSFCLVPLLIAAAYLLSRHLNVVVLVLCLSAVEAGSQMLGRSMMKLVIDLGLWSIVTAGYVVRRLYGSSIVDKTPLRGLSALHAEVLGMLRTTANVCMFVVGTLGITVASNVLVRYFDGALAQGTSWVYVLSILYLALGMYCFLLLPMFNTVTRIRERIGKEA